jgi:outer membrane protein OmpU
MTNLKKVGLTALAGSLVAVSAYAGELSVSGSAKFTYTADTGNEDAESDGNRFGMAQGLSFSGSGELDNGHTVSLLHVMSSDGGSKSTSVLTYDMGAMGSLKYQQDSGALGIGVIDDLTPTADEEVWNGLDADEHSDGSESLNGRVSGGVTGFGYTYSNDMLTVYAGYSPKSDTDSTADGGNGTGTLQSSQSIAVKVTPMDGLTVFAGTGEKGNSDGLKQDDHDTYGATYAWGPVTVGYQHSEIDDGTTSTTKDTDSDMYSIAFAVNENLSISYGEQDTSREGKTLDQEVKGYSVGYSMGGITIKAHSNKATNIKQTAARESEHTEIAVSFAF